MFSSHCILGECYTNIIGPLSHIVHVRHFPATNVLFQIFHQCLIGKCNGCWQTAEISFLRERRRHFSPTSSCALKKVQNEKWSGWGHWSGDMNTHIMIKLCRFLGCGGWDEQGHFFMLQNFRVAITLVHYSDIGEWHCGIAGVWRQYNFGLILSKTLWEQIFFSKVGDALKSWPQIWELREY